MSIPLQGLRDRLARTLGAGGPSFDTHFLAAINNVLSDFNRQCNRNVELVDDAGGTLDINARHTNTFFTGALFYLERSAEWAKEPSAITERNYNRALAMSQFESIDSDDLPAGIPAGDYGRSINQFDITGLSDINSETGTPYGGEGI